MFEMTAKQARQARPAPLLASASRLVQRRCACGGTPGPDGECAACWAKRLARQARSLSKDVPVEALALVSEVLRSPGRPLAPDTRTDMERRFGHDFSRVRVHTDASAADSAEAVNAAAYTVGTSIVFGAGRYAPTRSEGRHLLAHELAHVIQHDCVHNPPGRIMIGDPAAEAEREADAVASSIEGSLHPMATSQQSPVLRRQPKPTTPTSASPGSPSCTPRTGTTEYGCYCGAGSSCGSGLTCTPTDALDACCRQHDIDYGGCSFGDRYIPFTRCYAITQRADARLCASAHRLAGRFSGETERYRLGVLAIFCRATEMASAGPEGAVPVGQTPELEPMATPPAVGA